MKNLEKFGIFEEKARNYERILYVMALIHNVIEKRFYDFFAKHGTSAPKYNILLAVAYVSEGAGLNQKELGKHLITSPGNITKLVDSLYNDGLVSRVQNKASRRENIIKITPKGQIFIDKIWPEYDKLANGFADMLPKSAQKNLIEVLGKWFFALDSNFSK